MMKILNRLHYHISGFALLLCFILSAPLPCSSNKHSHESTFGGARDPIDVARPDASSERQLLEQQQQQLLLKHQERERMVQEENYCQLCQGLELLADKLPLGSPTPTTPCSELDLYYQFLYPEPTNLTMNVVGTCRADIGYNVYTDLCCKASIPKYECEQNVQELLFGDNAPKPYNTAVPPIVGVDEPLEVTVSITYQALEHIEVSLGTATIFMTVELKWVDPRLAWDVVNGDTCTNVIDVFTGQDVEATQIWVPDFDLLNQVDGFQSAPDSKALIFSDGTVFWTIAGGMEAFCAFSGLGDIPFDELGCQLLFGTNTRDYSKSINYELAFPDLVLTGAFDLTYNEWTVDAKRTKQGLAFDGNVIYYDIFFSRATMHYIQNIVVPTIILTFLSFFTYLLDMRVGERLGFGMALALVIVAQQIVTAELTPVSDQALFLDKFIAWSFYWVVVGVIQSVLIGFLYFKQEDRRESKEKTEQRRSVMLEFGHNKEEDAEEKMALANHREDALQEEEPEDFSRDSCLYTVDLRKVDLWSLFFAVVTYIIFIIVMFTTRKSGFWLRNEPRWFNENDNDYPTSVFDNNDPNT